MVTLRSKIMMSLTVFGVSTMGASDDGGIGSLLEQGKYRTLTGLHPEINEYQPQELMQKQMNAKMASLQSGSMRNPQDGEKNALPGRIDDFDPELIQRAHQETMRNSGKKKMQIVDNKIRHIARQRKKLREKQTKKIRAEFQKKLPEQIRLEMKENVDFTEENTQDLETFGLGDTIEKCLRQEILDLEDGTQIQLTENLDDPESDITEDIAALEPVAYHVRVFPEGEQNPVIQRTFNLYPGRTTIVGRTTTKNSQFASDKISECHLGLRCEENKNVMAYDMGSTNGSYILRPDLSKFRKLRSFKDHSLTQVTLGEHSIGFQYKYNGKHGWITFTTDDSSKQTQTAEENLAELS